METVSSPYVTSPEALEHVQDDMYALAFSQEIQVELADEFRPFLYPNQYAWFTRDDG